MVDEWTPCNKLKSWPNMLFNGISCYFEANFEILLLGYFFAWTFCLCYFLRFFNFACGMIDYEGEQYQYPIMEDYSPSNQIMPHTCWGELGSRSLISNSYSAVFVWYNCSGFIVGRFDCSICTVPMRDPGLDRCSPSLLPPSPLLLLPGYFSATAWLSFDWSKT